MATQKSGRSKAQPNAWFEMVGKDGDRLASFYSAPLRMGDDGSGYPAATTA